MLRIFIEFKEQSSKSKDQSSKSKEQSSKSKEQSSKSKVGFAFGDDS